MERDRRVAAFIDFENIALAVRDHCDGERVDLKGILDEVQRGTDGRIVVKRAYADWGTYRDYRSDLLNNAAEPVQVFALTARGKNGADIKIAIDVMDVVLRQTDITHVALVSGDSDFTPLVLKLRETGRYVYGMGVEAATSNYLVNSCDHFTFYDAIRTATVKPAALIAAALEALGDRPVTGSLLKMQIRRIHPRFDEQQLGFASFLDFLRAHDAEIEVYRPANGDVTVSRRRASMTPSSSPAAAPAAEPSAPLTTGDRYRAFLRENNFRYVPCSDRHQIIRVVYHVFTQPDAADISLKEAKDRVHLWFEENQPAVPWDSINSTVYHLFYTWCFHIERVPGDEGRALWDRRTTLQADVTSADNLIQRCERGIVRKIWERDRGEIDAEAVNEWLYDGDPDRLDLVRERIEDAVQHPVTPPSPAATGPTSTIHTLFTGRNGGAVSS